MSGGSSWSADEGLDHRLLPIESSITMCYKRCDGHVREGTQEKVGLNSDFLKLHAPDDDVDQARWLGRGRGGDGSGSPNSLDLCWNNQRSSALVDK